MLAAALINLKPGTAKTTCSIFLAAALHQLGRRVLLVDADKAMSTLDWSDDADGFPFRVIGEAVSSIRHQIVTVTEGSDVDAVVIDCPQMEDHFPIVRGALNYVWDQGAEGHAIVTVAAKRIELKRTGKLPAMLDQVREGGSRWALLNRTNHKYRTKTGPDGEAAIALNRAGFRVFADNVPDVDSIYSQSEGTWPLPLDSTPFISIAQEMING